MAVVAMNRTAGPGDADFEARFAADARAPMGDAVGCGREIRHRSRNVLQRRCERERQREQRAVQVERRQRIAARDDLDPGGGHHERTERLLNLENDVAAAGGHERQEAQELDGVAEALLGVQQDGLAVERLAAPLRLRKIARRQVADIPARLVFLPPGREVAAQKVQHAFARGRHAVVRIERARAAKARERLVHAAHVLQREPEVEVRDRKLRRERDRAAAGGFRLFRLPEGAQRVREVGMGFGIARPQLGRAAKLFGRFLEPSLLAQRRAQVVARLHVAGGELDHAAVARLGIAVALGFAQEIAELIMRLEEIGIEPDGLAEGRFGLLVAAQRAQREPEAVADVGFFRRERRCALDVGERGRRVAHAQRHDAEEVPGGGMLVVERKERAARRLRLLEPTLRLLGVGAGEQVADLRSARRSVFGRFQCDGWVRRG